VPGLDRHGGAVAQAVQVRRVAQIVSVANVPLTHRPINLLGCRRCVELHIGRAFAAILFICHLLLCASLSTALSVLFEARRLRPTACATPPQLIGECLRMPTPSRSQIIQSKPIAGGLDRFCAFFNSTYKDVGIPKTSQVLGPVGNEGIVDISFWSLPLMFTQRPRIV
jgi:hypothetical protein